MSVSPPPKDAVPSPARTPTPTSRSSAAAPAPATPVTSAPPPSSDPKVAELQVMFPSIDVSVIEIVLESCGGSQDRAIEQLLAMTDPNFKPDELHSARQEEAVSRLVGLSQLRASTSPLATASLTCFSPNSTSMPSLPDRFRCKTRRTCDSVNRAVGRPAPCLISLAFDATARKVSRARSRTSHTSLNTSMTSNATAKTRPACS